MFRGMIRHGLVCGDWERGLVSCAEELAGCGSQVGAFKVLDNAKKCADEHPGFSVFDEDGKVLYCSGEKKPGTDQEKTGKYTGVGSFTIVDEAEGVGASKWGLLKAYEKERDGWISLDYVTRME